MRRRQLRERRRLLSDESLLGRRRLGRRALIFGPNLAQRLSHVGRNGGCWIRRMRIKQPRLESNSQSSSPTAKARVQQPKL
eukprot:2963719-Prymnesium_polylepis.1